MLRIKDLVLTRDAKTLNYNLELPEGQCLAIQGLSGIGKSTLLEAISGFLNPDSGDILWLNQSLADLPPEKRPVAMMFQDTNLFEHLTVKQNIELGVKDNGDQLHTAVELLNLSGQLQKKPSSLSGGQRQRVALIRTMLRPEPIVLLDEPFSEQDQITRQACTDWVKKTMNSFNKTLVLVSHQHEDITELANQHLMLSKD